MVLPFIQASGGGGGEAENASGSTRAVAVVVGHTLTSVLSMPIRDGLVPPILSHMPVSTNDCAMPFFCTAMRIIHGSAAK